MTSELTHRRVQILEKTPDLGPKEASYLRMIAALSVFFDRGRGERITWTSQANPEGALVETVNLVPPGRVRVKLREPIDPRSMCFVTILDNVYEPSVVASINWPPNRDGFFDVLFGSIVDGSLVPPVNFSLLIQEPVGL